MKAQTYEMKQSLESISHNRKLFIITSVVLIIVGAHNKELMHIGGQAVIEGVMIKSPNYYSVQYYKTRVFTVWKNNAVRHPVYIIS